MLALWPCLILSPNNCVQSFESQLSTDPSNVHATSTIRVYCPLHISTCENIFVSILREFSIIKRRYLSSQLSYHLRTAEVRCNWKHKIQTSGTRRIFSNLWTENLQGILFQVLVQPWGNQSAFHCPKKSPANLLFVIP